MVNRGWIRQSMKPKEKRQESMITEEVDIIGVIRLTEKRPQFVPKNQPERSAWYYRYVSKLCWPYIYHWLNEEVVFVCWASWVTALSHPAK